MTISRRDMICTDSGLNSRVSGVVVLMVSLGVLGVAGAEPAGYLSRSEREPVRIRLEAPPKPPVPPLAPLPQTYIPEPQFTAEFLSELKTTSAMHRTNFTVRAETGDPVGLQMPPIVSPPVDPSPAGWAGDPDKSRQLLRYFFANGAITNGVGGMSGTSGVPVNVILPLRVSAGEAPAKGTAKATYELR